MRYRWTDPATQQVIELHALTVADMNGRMSDLAALQRETKWKLSEINEIAQLEGPGAALSIYLSFRATGRLISYSRAESLLDEIEPIEEPGDRPDEEAPAEDPTPAPTASVRGDDLPAVTEDLTGSLL